jgi:hypothetical protein
MVIEPSATGGESGPPSQPLSPYFTVAAFPALNGVKKPPSPAVAKTTFCAWAAAASSAAASAASV